MQPLVDISSTVQSLVLSPAVIGWKGSCNGHRSLFFQPRERRMIMTQMNDYGVNVAFPLVRLEDLSVRCRYQSVGNGGGACKVRDEGGGGRQGLRTSFVNTFFQRCSVQGGRRQFRFPRPYSARNKPKRHRPHQISSTDEGTPWQSQRIRRHYLHRVRIGSIPDFPFDLWDPLEPDESDDPSDEEGDVVHLQAGGDDDALSGGSSWTPRIGRRLPSLCSLLGFLPSWVDDSNVSQEDRQSSKNSQEHPCSPPFSVTTSDASFPPLLPSENPLQQLLTQDPLDNVYKFSSFKVSEVLSSECPLPPIEPSGRSLQCGVMDILRGRLYPRWMSRMSKTYGSAFVFLIALGYLLQGFRCFPWFAVSYLLKDGLQLDPAQMQFLMSTAAIPMVAKPIYGILSDSVYIGKGHRVPYLAISGLFQLISWGALALSPRATSSTYYVTAALTFGNLGAAIADVMNDALVAEMSKKSGVPEGELHSFVWMITAVGGLLGNLLGGIAIKHLPLASIFFIFLVMLGLHFVCCLVANEQSFNLSPLRDLPSSPSPSPANFINGHSSEDTGVGSAAGAGTLKRKRPGRSSAVTEAQASGAGSQLRQGNVFSQINKQLRVLGKLLRKKEISRTLLWVCASNAVVPVMGSGIFYFQTEVLKIRPTFIGLSRMVGQMGLMVGGQLYGGMLKSLPLRTLLGSVQVLLALCLLSDFALVKRINLQIGIPDELYVLGASPLVDCISQFKYLPVIIRLGQLCTPGSEGSLMALFSSCNCLAGLCSSYLGVVVAQHLRISSQSFEGLPMGILIQAIFTFLPVLCIWLMPRQEADPSSVGTREAEKVA